MIIAIRNDERVYASPKEKALCPVCKEEVIAKCGKIKIWHWSHKSLKDCDDWSETESDWHFNWKQNFPKEMQEVVIGKHRADIKTKEGKIIELQATNISAIKIMEREDFYKNMVWLLNGKTIAKNLIIVEGNFLWQWFPPSWKYSKKEVYVDYGNNLIKLHFYKKNDLRMRRGNYSIILKEDFINGKN